ncbi:MAG: GntR family transcriptional regulator [Patescibacteria group bacterium]
MWFHIDPASGTPIYLQIVEQVKQAVAGGVLRPGQRLPGTRDLAIELAVNPNTVVKAYQALEREGLIELPRGRGAFIAAGPRPGPEENLRLLAPAVERLVAEAYRLGCSDAAVLSLLEKTLARTRARRTGAAKEHAGDA